MIDISAANFEAEVIEASMHTPVLIDFWATWCAPCTALGPVLEKLEVAFEGRFKLAKVDADQEQQVASMFGIRSLPTCVLVINGQPVDGFQGAVPEGQVREFLDKHLPPAPEPEPTEEPELAPVGADEAIALLQAAVAAAPDNDEQRASLVKLLLLHDQVPQAQAAFKPLVVKAALMPALSALQHWLDAIEFTTENVATKDRESWTTEAFDGKIAANKRDFDARFARARVLFAKQDWTGAMDELLEILMRDKAWGAELARKTYVAILEIMAPPKVKVADGQIPPEDAQVASYRRRLSMIVLS